MNICIITNGYPINCNDWQGAFSRYFAMALQELGCEVFVFTPNRRAVKESNDSFEVFWFPWLGGKKSLAKLKFYNPIDTVEMISVIINGNINIIKYIKKNNIDFCLALWAAPSGVFAMHAKKKLGVPYAVWCLGSDVWIYAKYFGIRQIIQKVLKNADYVFADGMQLCEEAKEVYNRKYEFLATSRVLPKNIAVKEKIDKNKTNFLFIGRIERVKGIDILLEAFNIMIHQEKEKNIACHIFGVGEWEDFIQEKIRAYALEEFTFFKGYASAETSAAYLGACDWLIIPSRNESIPVVFSDALQMGIPVIISNVGDMGYLAEKNNVGLVFESENVKALTMALKKAIQQKNQRDILYTDNIKNLAKRFDIATQAKKFLDIVGRILNKQ